MTSLGLMYRDGKGIPEDRVTAYKWLHLSWTGDGSALESFMALENTLSEEEKNKAKAMAAKWYKEKILKQN